MHDLTVKNFALFKENTIFKLTPLTLLIGANNSGKSSFIKLLSLFQKNFNSYQVSKFDLGNFQVLFNDKNKPIELCHFIANNLYVKTKIEIQKIQNTGEEIVVSSDDDFYTEFVDSKNNTLLIIEIQPHNEDKPYVKIKLEIDLPIFLEVLNQNNFEELKNKLILSGIPDEKRSLVIDLPEFLDPRFLEIWLINEGIYTFLNHFTSNLIIEKEELTEKLSLIFANKSYKNQLLNSYSGQTIDGDSIELDIIRISDLGIPKRVFSKEDPFGKTLNEFDLLTSPGAGSIFEGRSFLDKWLKEFLGNECNFTYRRLQKDLDFFVTKLNNHFLTEHGTGVYRILHLIIKLSTYVYSHDFLTYFNEEQNSLLKYKPFLKKKFLVIEEPEANLHPNFQIKLAEMLYALTQKSDCHVIIETHSEYMIRTFQYLVAKNEAILDQVGIINFGSEKNAGKIKHISIRPNGSLSDNFYSGFLNYSEDLRLKLDAVNNKRNN